MRPIQPQRKSSAGFWLGLLLIVLAGLGGIASIFWAMGIGPWASSVEDPFVVRIPINARPIPAYVKVQREDLLNPATQAIAFQNIPPAATIGMSITGISTDGTPVEGQVESVKDDDGVVFVVAGKDVRQSRIDELGGALMNISSIIGRVVKNDKRAGMGFRESTFFPKGTPEGIAGAIPQGMRAVTLDATKLTGIHSLNSGNRLDLLASMPSGSNAGPAPVEGLLANQRPSSRNDAATEPVLLARNALILKPVSIRNETTISTSLTSGQRQVNQPKYEVTIAVEPDDVIPLQDALNKELMITCVAASMQPVTDQQQSADTASNQLMAPVTVRSIPAYEVITREAFISPATRTIRMEPVSQRQVDNLGLTLHLEEMLGSVARHDIPAGSFVRQNDILKSRRGQNHNDSSSDTASDKPPATRWQTAVFPAPQQNEEAGANIVGDRPAVTNFIPPGYTAIAVPWNRIFGSEHLQIDDHLDLLVSYPIERKRQVSETDVRSAVNVVTKEYDEFVTRETDRTRDESLAERGEPWFIATDAIVIGPVGFPPPNAAMRAIGNSNRQAQGERNAQVSGPAILLAIDTRDLESLATVLNTPDFLLSVAFRIHPDRQQIPAGFRQIAVAPVEIAAYSEFSDLHWKGLRREITSRLVSDNDPRFANAIGMDQIESYYGRVLNTAKTRFAVFTPDDFMPEGSKAGVAAAVGPSSVLVVVTADQVQAINRFRDNDEVVLLMTGNFELPGEVVIHSSVPLGPGARVVVKSARIVRAASDVSDMVALEVQVSEAAALSAALFAHDATDTNRKHDRRLVAVARPRSGANPRAGSPQRLTDHMPLDMATQVYEVTGDQARTHIFSNNPGE